MFDESPGVDTTTDQLEPLRGEPDEPQHRAVDHLRRKLRRVRDRRQQRQGRRELPARRQWRARHLHLGPRSATAELRRLSEPGNGSDLPGASGAPALSGNGNLLLFRTQAVNAGAGLRGASSPPTGSDGKSTTGQVPSPTNDTPPPPDIPPAPPTGSTEDPSTSGDGNTTGNTTEPDPGTGGAEPVVEVDETPEDADGTPSSPGLSPSAGPTTGGNVVEILGGNFADGQRRCSGMETSSVYTL